MIRELAKRSKETGDDQVRRSGFYAVDSSEYKNVISPGTIFSLWNTQVSA